MVTGGTHFAGANSGHAVGDGGRTGRDSSLEMLSVYFCSGAFAEPEGSTVIVDCCDCFLS